MIEFELVCPVGHNITVWNDTIGPRMDNPVYCSECYDLFEVRDLVRSGRTRRRQFTPRYPAPEPFT